MDVWEQRVPTAAGGWLATRLAWPRSLGVPREAPLLPAELAKAARGVAVLIVHQYSIMGGSQDLMRGLARELAFRHGLVAVTFNQRGVGDSSGWSTLTGHGEADDTATMGAWLQAAGFSRVLLLCVSAGGPIGGSALDRCPAFSAYVALGYVFGFAASLLFGGHFRAVLDSSKPKLFVQAAGDEFTGQATLLDWAAPQSRAHGTTETRIVPGVGHFSLEGPEWDAHAVRWALAFAHRVNAFGEAAPASCAACAAAEAAELAEAKAALGSAPVESGSVSVAQP